MNTTDNIGWRFPNNDYGAISGINNAGIVTFKGKGFSSLAREICQNSLDACQNKEKPVEIKFEKFKINTKEMPNYKEFKEIWESCEEFWSNQEAKNESKFIAKGFEILNSKELSVLRISDFNTTGLTGLEDENNKTSKWSALVKSAGLSNKQGDSAGSFGIGKSAPFACSDIRTIFYESMDTKGNIASQGVSKLISHYFKFEGEKITTQGTGYYGKKNKLASINNFLEIQKDYKRKEAGTDIYIIGFIKSIDWKEKIIKSIIESFMITILEEKLVVSIDDNKIDSKTILNYIKKYSSDNKEYKDMINTVNYYNAYINAKEKGEMFKFEFKDLGEVELRAIIEKDLHRKILMCRSNGMKIYEQNRISGIIPFSAVMILKGKKINEFFREMENPEHSEWNPELHENPKKAKKYKKELINDELKQRITNMNKIESKEIVDAKGVGEYLPYELQQGEKKETKEELSSKIKEFEVKLEKDKKNKLVYDNEKIEGGNTGEGQGNGSISHKTNGKGGKKNLLDLGGSGDNGKKNKIIGLSKERLIAKSNNEYKIILIPKVKIKNAYLEIKMSGEKDTEKVNIIKARMKDKKLKFKKNKIYLDDFDENSKISIEYKVDFDEKCAMEVKLYADK